MSSNYPGAIDTTDTFPVRADGTTTAAQHAADHNNLADAVIKIQTELGVDPSGAFATVLARLNATATQHGTFAERPNADTAPGGRYFATDIRAEYLSNGVDWIRTSAAAGELVSFPGLNLPSDLVRLHGQNVSRSGKFEELFKSETIALSGSGDSGQPTLTFSAVPEGVGSGHSVEGTGISASATVVSVTSTTVTLSHNLSTSGARSVRFFPHGNGDGSTTFTLADARGKADFGRDNMGGTQAGANYRTGSVMGAVGGKIAHLLTAAESGLRGHGHSVSESSAGSHSHTVDSHNHGGSTGGNTANITGAGTTTNGSHAHRPSLDSHFRTLASGQAGTYQLKSDQIKGGTGAGYYAEQNNYNNSHTDNSGLHSHTVTINQSGHSHSISSQSPGTNSTGSHTHSVSVNAASDVNATSAHENRPPFLITDKCVRL